MIEILRKYCVHFYIDESEKMFCDASMTVHLSPTDECCEINCPIIKELREKIK